VFITIQTPEFLKLSPHLDRTWSYYLTLKILPSYTCIIHPPKPHATFLFLLFLYSSVMVAALILPLCSLNSLALTFSEPVAVMSGTLLRGVLQRFLPADCMVYRKNRIVIYYQANTQWFNNIMKKKERRNV